MRRISSRALRAAWRARLAEISLLTIARASFGCSSRYSESLALHAVSTMPRMDGLPSLVFVWPSNCGSRSFTDTIAARPSRQSSPVSGSSFSFRRPLLRAYSLSVRVSDALNPDRWVPPSWVLMLLANE